MSDGPYPREVVFDSLRSGLTTDSMLEDDPPALRVSWIASCRRGFATSSR